MGNTNEGISICNNGIKSISNKSLRRKPRENKLNKSIKVVVTEHRVWIKNLLTKFITDCKKDNLKYIKSFGNLFNLESFEIRLSDVDGRNIDWSEQCRIAAFKLKELPIAFLFFHVRRKTFLITFRFLPHVRDIWSLSL